MSQRRQAGDKCLYCNTHKCHKESSVDVTVQAVTNQTVPESTELQNINKEMCDVYFVILQMLLVY